VTLLFDDGAAFTVKGPFTRKVFASGTPARSTVPDVVEMVNEMLAGCEFAGAGNVNGSVQAFETTVLFAGKMTAPAN
jgi:hypothetical protein